MICPYSQFQQMWDFVLSKYETIFLNDRATIEWVNKYTMVLKISGENPNLKPGLFIAHTDVVPADNQWETVC